MRYLRSIIYELLVLLAISGAFAAGYLLRWNEGRDKFPILLEAHQLLIDHGLKDNPGPPALEYGMIRGMIQAYDEPYTSFLEPPQNELEGNLLSGRYGGIGADVIIDTQGNRLLYPYSDGPAAKAGIQDGDRLLRVDGQDITLEMSTDAVLSLVRGPVGEPVQLQIGRPPDYQPLALTIEFAEYPLPSVTWRIAPEEPRVGIVHVNLIAASTKEEILNAVRDLKDRGSTHFILDLRDNPGGLLDAGVDIARLFLKDGVVMEQQYRGRDVERFMVDEPGPLADIPLVVLINNGSASAAEIAAGALRAHHRARLIGEPSYGKDSIQLVFPLQDGSSLHITSARWWIPNGDYADVPDASLQPDVLVPSNADGALMGDPYIVAAIQNLLTTNQP